MSYVLFKPKRSFTIDKLHAFFLSLVLSVSFVSCANACNQSANLQNPNGLAFDSGNNLYVANYGDGDVVKYSITYYANNGVKTLSPITCVDTNSPTRLTFDTNGNLYVTNAGNTNTVTVYNPNLGLLTTIPQLTRPLGIAVDSGGKVYIAENAGNAIAVYQPITTGQPSAGFKPSFTPVTQDSAGHTFSAPGFITELTLDGVNVILVGIGPTSGNDTINLYPASWTSTPQFKGLITNGPTCPPGPSGPTGIAVDNTNANAPLPYISNYYSSTVTGYTFAALILAYYSGSTSICPMGTMLTAANQIAHPEGIAVDKYGNLFVSNSSSNQITAYDKGFGPSATPSLTYK